MCPFDDKAVRLSRADGRLYRWRTLHFQLVRRPLGDDVDDLERHHYVAGLIDFFRQTAKKMGARFCSRPAARAWVTSRNVCEPVLNERW